MSAKGEKYTSKAAMKKHEKSEGSKERAKEYGPTKVAKVMHEFKAGSLHSGPGPKGPKKGKIVKSRKQAVAIAMSQAGMARKSGRGR